MKGLLALLVFYLALNVIALMNGNRIPEMYIYVLFAADAAILIVAFGSLKQ